MFPAPTQQARTLGTPRTACNCHYTSAHVTTYVLADHEASFHHSVAHIACPSTFWEAWPMPKPSPLATQPTQHAHM